MKAGSYWRHAAPFKRQLAEHVSHAELRRLHERVWWKHYAILGRQLILASAAAWLAAVSEQPLIWLPCSIFLGFCAFNFTVLLHEAVHSTLFQGRHPRLEAAMGYLYALPSGISRSQFTRWHLDHHNELGTELDPKRHWLSPRVVKRWYKALYCTPALFPKYFRAAARESASYPPGLQRRIQRERLVTVAVHVLVMAALIGGGGWALYGKLYAIPYFLVFPVAFTLNRLGQHYNIDPSHPLKWGTLMKPSRFWDFLFLFSNYHLEHHYFPSVPFYNLRRLHFALAGFYEREGIRPHSYRDILWGWFVENRVPHTDWDAAGSDRAAREGSSVATAR